LRYKVIVKGSGGSYGAIAGLKCKLGLGTTSSPEAGPRCLRPQKPWINVSGCTTYSRYPGFAYKVLDYPTCELLMMVLNRQPDLSITLRPNLVRTYHTCNTSGSEYLRTDFVRYPIVTLWNKDATRTVQWTSTLIKLKMFARVCPN